MFVQSHIQRVQRHNHHNNRQRHQPTGSRAQTWPSRSRRLIGVIRPTNSLRSSGGAHCKQFGLGSGSSDANRTTAKSLSTLTKTAKSSVGTRRQSTRATNSLKNSKCFGKSISCPLISQSNSIVKQSSSINKRNKKSTAIGLAQSRCKKSNAKFDLGFLQTFCAWTFGEISKQLSNLFVLLLNSSLLLQWQTVQRNAFLSTFTSTIAKYCRPHWTILDSTSASPTRFEPKMRPSANLHANKFAPGDSSGRPNSLDESLLNAIGSNKPDRCDHHHHQRCLIANAHNSIAPCGLHCLQQPTVSTRSSLVTQSVQTDQFDEINQIHSQHQPPMCAGFGPLQDRAHARVPLHWPSQQMTFDFAPSPSRCHQPELVSLCRHHHHQDHQLPLASAPLRQHCWHNQGQHYYSNARPAPEGANLVATSYQQRIGHSGPVFLADSGEQFRQHSIHSNYNQAQAPNHFANATLLASSPSGTFHSIASNRGPEVRPRNTRNESAGACPSGRGSLRSHEYESVGNALPHYHQHQHFHGPENAPLFDQQVESSSIQYVNQNASANRVERHQRKLSSILGSNSELWRPQSQPQVSNGPVESFSSSSVTSSLSSLSVANDQTKLAKSTNLTNANQPNSSGVDFSQLQPLRRSVHPLDGVRLHWRGSSTTSEASYSQQGARKSQSQSQSSQQSSNLSKLTRQNPLADCGESPTSQTKSVVDNEQTLTSAPQETEANDEKDKGRSQRDKSVKLAACGKSRSLMHSPIGLVAASTLGKISLAGAKRRLGFKQNRGLDSLSVHRSEEIFPSELNSNCHLHNQLTGVPINVSSSLNDSSLELGPNHQVGPPSQLHRKWLTRFSSESPDPKVCFVEGLGVGQIVSRQALVSPYLGDIQISLSERRGVLEVEVIRVRQLQAAPRAKRPPTFYVKVYLMKDKKCLAKVKTSPISHTLNPLFQQLFIFRENYRDCVLQIIVWANYGKTERKSLTGSVQIQLNDLDISNVVIGWYRLFNAPSMVPNQLIASSPNSLRQTLSTAKLTDSSSQQ